MSFDMGSPTSINFGVIRGPISSGDYELVPVHAEVQGLLLEMVATTRGSLTPEPGVPLLEFEPSQDYPNGARVTLGLSSPLCEHLRQLYGAENLPINSNALADPQSISAYFTVIRDKCGQKLLGLRRASQFKAVLKSRLLRILDDGLHAISDNVFKLDREFDLLVGDDAVVVLSVTAFEHLGEIDEHITKAAMNNIGVLQSRVGAVGFESLAPYVAGHKRAARLISALCCRKDLKDTSPVKLRRACKMTGVDVQTVDGRLCPSSGHELAFLQLLDRRRYSISLVPRKLEQYEASNRRGVGVQDQSNDKSFPSKASAAQG